MGRTLRPRPQCQTVKTPPKNKKPTAGSCERLVNGMTMEEFLQLSAKDMLDVIKNDPDFRHNPEAGKAFNKKAFEDYKKWMIEDFGYYDPDLHLDLLPRNRVKKD